ncbi:acetyl-CoA acetyltransferase [Altererythrobacter sp. SALINAS58]|uniref:acetyl-CoA acetyltransferase n=1 Tax=Alteripontixanthobacter muriae TaxID=2705546 RepID=UPI0015756277|nr:acetyl-CoA acetyltransferase [Alteripontixanthobacter muriae]NTZ42864.1 acetyl-CoA acetyltransferase [Alteripontixanthobacter muriae]
MNDSDDYISDETPVIIGAGQSSERIGEAGYRQLSPMELAAEALRAAISDSGAGPKDLATAIDTVAAIRQFEISTPGAEAPFGKSNNPPRSIARRVGADPDRAILEVVGGQGPQDLVGELAAEIAAGRSRCAAIVGAEAISTMLDLRRRGVEADWSEHCEGTLEDRGYGMSGMIDATLIANGMGRPIPGYALFENARRAAFGLSPEDYRAAMGELLAPFTDVAANNPHAAMQERMTAAQLAQVDERNRLVAEPYARFAIARDQVNQGAAIILTSAGTARELLVPRERWIFVHASVSAKEASVLQRADLSRSPAAIGAVREALALAERGIDEIGFMDLYSCFPIAVFNIMDAFGLKASDPRRLTLTGGLPFFGGAGNNYSAHAIAEAVQRLRVNRDAFALVGANGGIMSKYACGIYSARPAGWSADRVRRPPEVQPSVAIAEIANGPGMVESYTYMPERNGGTYGIVARLADGRRAVAMEDGARAAGLAALGEPIGRDVLLSSGERGRNSFTFN